MFIRFITEENDSRTGKPKGICTLAYELIENGELYVEDEKSLKKCLLWVEKNVPIPTRFSRANNEYRKNTGGLSWLKPEADEAVSRFWKVKNTIDIAGYSTKVVKTKNPGKMVYEDSFQIVAIPFFEQKF